MKTKNLILASLFAVITFISSYLLIPIGPVPFTAQTFCVVITGLCLRPSLAFLAQVTNALLMIVFKSAIGSPTFGFILGFIVAATLISWLTHSQKCPKIIAVIIGSLAIYLVGVPYFTMLLSQKYTLLSALSVTFTPFILGDTIKAVLAIIVANHLKPLLAKS